MKQIHWLLYESTQSEWFRELKQLSKLNRALSSSVQDSWMFKIRGEWIGVCKSADPLNFMAESVDPLKKSTKSESAITDPSHISALPFLVIFSTAWHRYIRKRKVSFPGRCCDPRSALANNQNPKSGPIIWIKPRSAVIIGSADPLKFRSESTIRAKIFTKSTDPETYSPPSR